MNVIIDNRKAKFNYEFILKYNAGIELYGSEVKAIKSGYSNIVDAFCYIDKGEIFIKNFIITSKSDFFEHDPNRAKKLLLKKREINKISNTMDKYLTIIPIKFFINERNKIKCEIAVAKGKKNYDKRNVIKDRDNDRMLKQEF
jgi:SsrA-binding protein